MDSFWGVFGQNGALVRKLPPLRNSDWSATDSTTTFGLSLMGKSAGQSSRIN